MSGEAPARADTPRSDGTLLGGRLIYRQTQAGYRTGIEPVLLAASIPVRPGERVAEGGTGAGAGLLCLAARVPGLVGLGLEIDPGLVEAARGNITANGFAGLDVHGADVCAWRADGPLDHAFANPPWHDPGGTPSPDRGRRLAKQAGAGLLARWAMALGTGLRRGGTLSLILPAASMNEGCAALAASGCGRTSLFPLWPREGQAAKLIILRGVRGVRGADTVMPGLILHAADGRYTEAAEQVLRHGAALMQPAGPARGKPQSPPECA